MEALKGFYSGIKSFCNNSINYISKFIHDKCDGTSKIIQTIYLNKKQEYKVDNIFLLSFYTVFNIITLVTKIFYNKLKHYFKKVRQSSECTYYYHGKKYRIYFKRHKYYSTRIVEAHDLTNNKNIIETIREYAGPYENFHNEKVTPANLGYNHIRITIMDGCEVNVKEYNKDDIIII